MALQAPSDCKELASACNRTQARSEIAIGAILRQRFRNLLMTLRQLHIKHSHVSDFLAHIALPHACVVELHNTTPSPYYNTYSSLHDLLPRDLATFQQLAAADRVRARVLKPAKRQGHYVSFEAYANGSRTLSVECLSNSTYYHPLPDAYRRLLPSMPRLRSVELEDDARNISMELGKISESGKCACPQLEELNVLWRPGTDEFFKGPDVESRRLSKTSPGYTIKWHKSGLIVLAVFCAYIRRMLLDRAAAGATPLKRLHVRVSAGGVGRPVYDDQEDWEPAALREGMLAHLGSTFQGELVVSVVGWPGTS